MCIKLKYGKKYDLKKNQDFIVNDDKLNPYKVYSSNGAKVFIID
jgi:hypothetical protein